MGEHTVRLDEEAYRALVARQNENETISETVLRITGEATAEGIDREALGEEERAVVEALDRMFEAQRDHDMEAFLDQMHPAVDTTETEGQLRPIWSSYELTYETAITDLEVEGDEARALVEQKTEKVAGPEFKDNVTVDLHHLEKEGDRWWVVATETQETNFLS